MKLIEIAVHHYLHIPEVDVRHDSHGDAAFHRRIEEMFQLLLTQGANIMSVQDDINTAVAATEAKITALEAANTDLKASQAAMTAELVDIKAKLDAALAGQPTSVDLTALNSINSRIDALVTDLQAEKAADDAATAANTPT